MSRLTRFATTAMAAAALAAITLTTFAPPAEARLGQRLIREYVQERNAGKDLAERLEQRGNFTTLLSLLEATGLASTVADGGPFTVLAPNDDAFGKLDQATLDFLADNPDVLTSILLYHVIPGEFRSFDLLRVNTVETVQGGFVLATRENRRVFVNDSEVVRANLKAFNGVIHEIDTVLSIPEEPVVVENIIDVLELDGRFGLLLTVLEDADLTGALEAPDAGLTLYAPTDEAFLALGEETIEAVRADIDLLTSILLYHVSPERLTAIELLTDGDAATLQGSDVDIRFRRGGLRVNDASVIAPNVSAPNGIIHFIDAVLLPPTPAGN
jgi:uncharacterized surface protein with fasciclin (FAS1) repeats